MTDNINPAHYTSGKVECIDALEAATVNLTGTQAVCTANAEQWRTCTFDGRYEVSSAGQVRHGQTKRVRKPSTTPAGYKTVVVSNPGSKHTAFYVHRAVAAAFIGECPIGMQVSHLDGNNKNNRLENLKYETQLINNRRKKEHGTEIYGCRNGSAKLNKETVISMKAMRSASKITYSDIAKAFGVSEMTAYRAVNDQTRFLMQETSV